LAAYIFLLVVIVQARQGKLCCIAEPDQPFFSMLAGRLKFPTFLLSFLGPDARPEKTAYKIRDQELEAGKSWSE
jgi:hypothetical protein